MKITKEVCDRCGKEFLIKGVESYLNETNLSSGFLKRKEGTSIVMDLCQECETEFTNITSKIYHEYDKEYNVILDNFINADNPFGHRIYSKTFTCNNKNKENCDISSCMWHNPEPLCEGDNDSRGYCSLYAIDNIELEYGETYTINIAKSVDKIKE